MLNRDGDVRIDVVLVICSPEWTEEPLLALGLDEASNSKRSLKRPPCRISTKTSADDTPSGLMWRQI